MQDLLRMNTEEDDIVIYTDGSVVRGSKSGWGFSARIKGRVVAEKSGAYMVTTTSLRMEIEAVTAAVQWLSETSFVRAAIVTDSQPVLRNISSGWFCHELLECLEASQLLGLV